MGGAPREQQARQPGREHAGERAGEEDHQPLDHQGKLVGDGLELEIELRPALEERAEQQARRQYAEGVVAAHERNGDAGEAVAGGEVEHQLVLDAQHLVERHAARKRAGERHRGDHRAPDRNAGIARRLLAVADGAQRIAELGAPDQHPDRRTGQEGKQEGEVERRAGSLESQAANEVVDRRQPNGLIEQPGLRRPLSRPHHRARKQPDHQPGGQEVEHDRRDDDVAAAICLQPPRHHRPCRAEERRATDRRERDEPARQHRFEREAGKRYAEAAQRRLALRPDIEQPGLEGERSGKAGEDEVGGVIERVAERAGRESSLQQDPEDLQRVLADQRDHDCRRQQRKRQVDDREDADIEPARQGGQAVAPSAAPVIISPSCRGVAPSAATVPATRPPFITTIRSASARISSSSVDTSRIAEPRSFNAMT